MALSARIARVYDLTLGVAPLDKLQRLKQELEETKSLLTSTNVKYLMRWVLENLRDDLQRQIANMESELDKGDNRTVPPISSSS